LYRRYYQLKELIAVFASLIRWDSVQQLITMGCQALKDEITRKPGPPKGVLVGEYFIPRELAEFWQQRGAPIKIHKAPRKPKATRKSK
jgi:hypothetical protein